MTPNYWDSGLVGQPVPAHQRTWGHLTYPYIKNTQVFHCPSNSSTAVTPTTAGAWAQLSSNSYGYSGWMSNRAAAEIVAPSELFLMMDAQSIWNDTCQNARRLCFRHNEGGNFAFADGHVKWRRSRTPRAQEWWPTLTAFHGTDTACSGATGVWNDYATSACLP